MGLNYPVDTIDLNRAVIKAKEYSKATEEKKKKTGIFTQSKKMDDLHKKGGKRKNYSFYWVGNTGDQPLWTPKWHSILSEK